MTWRPTTELRFFVDEGPKILQQKWIQYADRIIRSSPTDEGELVNMPNGVFKWVDVPLVEAKDELAD